MRDAMIIVTGNPISEDQKARLNEAAFGMGTSLSIVEAYDALEDEELRLLDFGTRGLYMDRSGSMDHHMIISLGDEISRMAREDYLSIRVYEDEIKAPLGKSPDKIRRRQKDWEVGSGRGLRR